MLCTLRKRVGVNAVTLDVGPDEELKEVGGGQSAAFDSRSFSPAFLQRHWPLGGL